jgi:hypothetical protein
MPCVVPSDVVAAIDRMFPQMVEVPTAFPQVNADAVPLISALVSLVEAVPHNLLVLRKCDGLSAIQQVVPGVAVSGGELRRRGNTGKEPIPGRAQALGRNPRQRPAEIASSDLEDDEVPMSEVEFLHWPIAAHHSVRSKVG